MAKEEEAKSKLPVSDNQIQEWKKTHGAVFKTTLNDEAYIYRYLTRTEYKKLVDEQYEAQSKIVNFVKDSTKENDEVNQREMQKKDNELILLFEEKVLESCLLYPKKDPEDMPSGLVTSICDEIMKASGFGVQAVSEKL